MQRFAGGVEFLAKVDVKALAKWIGALTPEDWPEGWSCQGRPYVLVDPVWQDWRGKTDKVVAMLVEQFPECHEADRAITTVHPGSSVPDHVDLMLANWITRVHVPLMTNSLSTFVVGGQLQRLEVGSAYLVNPEKKHSILNGGGTPRVHLMFDVVR